MPGVKVFLLLVSISYCTANAVLQEYEDRDWIDYRLARAGFSAETTDVPISCSTPGPFCENCQDVYFCRTNDTGHMEAEKIDECKDPYTCNNGQCSKTPTPECAVERFKFDCVSHEGMYPDPGNCREFHYCVPDGSNKKHYKSTCGKDSEYGYNPVSTYCNVKLSETGCKDVEVVPLCETLGQSGIIKDKPSMYYTCLPYEDPEALRPDSNVGKLYPYLYLCKNGREYDPSIFGCRPL